MSQKLPSWMLQHLSTAETEKRLVQQAVQKMSAQIPIIDSKYKVRGFRDIGMFFSLGEDPEYPRVERVTKAIKEFDPLVIPMLCRWVFISPEGKEVVFRRHAVGTYNPNVRFQADPIPCELPANYNGPIPNKLILIWEGAKNPDYLDTPGAYLPWDWNLYWKLKSAFIDFKDKKALIAVERAKKDAAELALAKAREEAAYQQRDLQNYTTKKLEQMSEVELKEFALYGRHIVGRQEKKPFITVKR